MIFATACGFAYLWATYIVPETANVSLEEIDSLFNSSAGKEDAIMKRQVKTNDKNLFFSSSARFLDLFSFFLFFASGRKLIFFCYLDRGRVGIEGFDSRFSRGFMNVPSREKYLCIHSKAVDGD